MTDSLSYTLELPGDTVSLLSEDERAYYRRECIEHTFDAYLRRLKTIGFEGKERVLDCACGLGQWTLAMSALNKRVDACDISTTRLLIAQRLAAINGVTNIRLTKADMKALPYDAATFDCVFCYGALMFGDPVAAFKEFARVLKTEGVLYVCVNTAEWYLLKMCRSGYTRHSIVTAIRAVLSKFIGNVGRLMVLDIDRLEELGRRNNLRVVKWGAEGSVSVTGSVANLPVFYPEMWRGRAPVIEAILVRDA